jgi:hypothetical protein
VSQYLVIGQGEQRGIGDDGEHVMPFGSELIGDMAGQHLIQQQWVAHLLSGE